MSVFDPYIGLPYRDKGRGPDAYDCWGLLHRVYLDLLGVELPSYAEGYVTAADRHALAKLIAGEIDDWMPIERGAEKQFDGVLMREGRIPSHIGIVTAPGKLLHVSEGSTSRVEQYSHGILSQRVVGIYRFKAVQ